MEVGGGGGWGREGVHFSFFSGFFFLLISYLEFAGVVCKLESGAVT